MAEAGAPRRSAARAERRREILETATRLFHGKGYQSVSLDDIAERISFTKAALYYYFESKEEIVDVIVDTALERTRAIAAGGGSVTDRLHDVLVEHTRLILENIEENTVFYNSRGMLSPQREQDVRGREREYTLLVRDLYAEGVRTGRVPRRRPVRGVVHAAGRLDLVLPVVQPWEGSAGGRGGGHRGSADVRVRGTSQS